MNYYLTFVMSLLNCFNYDLEILYETLNEFPSILILLTISTGLQLYR